MASYSPLLSSKLRLERDRGLEVVKELLKDPKEDVIATLEKTIASFLLSESWEPIHGALLAGGCVIGAGLGSRDLCMKMQGAIPALLEHKEPRIRLSAGWLVGSWGGGGGGRRSMRYNTFLASSTYSESLGRRGG